mgnify:FL=1
MAAGALSGSNDLSPPCYGTAADSPNFVAQDVAAVWPTHALDLVGADARGGPCEPDKEPSTLNKSFLILFCNISFFGRLVKQWLQAGESNKYQVVGMVERMHMLVSAEI